MKTFKEIVELIGNKSYSRVELRCNMSIRGNIRDVFVGVFAYDGEAKRIIPLDGDSYSMDMLCEQWNEFETDKGKCLCVYAQDGNW